MPGSGVVALRVALRVGLLSLLTPTRAAVTFTANAAGSLATLRFPLLDCVGSGHGALTLREDYRTHLRKVQADIGFASVRGHGWLDDDLSTYLPGGGESGTTVSMYNIFSTIDFYQSVRIRPILELSFMPEALASDPSKTIMVRPHVERQRR